MLLNNYAKMYKEIHIAFGNQYKILTKMNMATKIQAECVGFMANKKFLTLCNESGKALESGILSFCTKIIRKATRS